MKKLIIILGAAVVFIAGCFGIGWLSSHLMQSHDGAVGLSALFGVLWGFVIAQVVSILLMDD